MKLFFQSGIQHAAFSGLVEFPRSGYVAASRFRERLGVYLYGKVRRTDFLPVGEDQEDEVTERGYDSQSSDDDDDEYAMQRMYEARQDGAEENASDAENDFCDAEVSLGL